MKLFLALVVGNVAAVAGQDEVVMNDGTPLPGFTKFLLKDAATAGAVCLDGSPGGGYIRRGDPAHWIIFHQGGGWCTSDLDCAARANCSATKPGCITGRGCCAMGSSTVWGPTYTDSYEGAAIFSDPAFSNHTIFYAMYCDGGSWTGDMTATVPVGGATVHYRGRRLLDALLDALLAEGLGKASTLLYGGCSAGGLTAYLHADYVASRMPAGVKVVALADAMFSRDAPTWDGATTFLDHMRWGYDAWNASSSGNTACIAHYGITEGWRCFFGCVKS
jgi:ribosome maturation protein SDO1